MLVKLISQVQATKGKLVYEYNPFRNYRLTQNMYYFRDNFYSKKDKECIREIIGKKDNDNCECNFQSILDTEVDKLKEVANE